MAITTLICYDISGNDTRARVAAYLQHYGDRIQRSVFVCALDTDDLTTLTTLTTHLTSLINPDTDAIHITPTCATCWNNTTTLGQAHLEPAQPYWIAL